MIKGEKLVSIQALRALAFIGILCQHCSIARLGTWGVSVFFVLSGFILTYTSLQGENTFAINTWGGIMFSASKIKKLYITHIVTTLAMLILTLYSMYIDGILSQLPQQLFYLLANLLLVQDWFKEEVIRCSFNGVAWYLSAMTFLYFTFPFIFVRIRKYKTYKSAFVVLSFTYILQIMITFVIRNNDSYYITYFFPPYRWFDFFAGSNIGYIYYYNANKNIVANSYNKRETIKYTLYEAGGAVFMAVTIYINWNITIDKTWINNSLLYLPSSCVLIYLFACGRGWITKILSNKVLVDLGDISGYTFLIHQTVLYYFQALYYKITGEYVTPIPQVIAVFFLTLAITKIWIYVCASFRNKIGSY